MVVCKFFLQGECRFGENCRFEHQLSSEKHGNQQFGSIQNQSKLVNPKTGTEIELSTLLNSVKNDVVTGENGKQWVLSCYAPFKEKPPYPDFVDMSFEEVRFGFFEAQKSNTLQQYNQQLQQLITEARMRFKSLENPTNEIVELLKNIYNNNLNSGNKNVFSQSSQESGTLKGLFGLNNSTVFGQQNNNTSIFRQQDAPNNFVQQNGNVFGQSNTGSIFGQQQNATNVFQQGNLNQNNGSLFGQKPIGNGVFGQKPGSAFGLQPTGTSIFGQQKNANNMSQQNMSQSTSVFGQTTGSTSIFGQNSTNSGQIGNSPFNQSNTGSIFGKPAIFGQQSSGNIFTQQNKGLSNSGSIFSGSQITSNSGSIFVQQNNSSPATIIQNQSNVFGQSNSVQEASSMFAANPTQNTSIFQMKPSVAQQTNSIFNTQNNLFSANSQSGVFGNVQQINSTQQGRPFVSQNPQQQVSIFGKNIEQGNMLNQGSFVQNPQSGSIFGSNQMNQRGGSSEKACKNFVDWGAYSKIEDLTEEQIKWFNSETFDIDCIPERPPTFEMC